MKKIMNFVLVIMLCFSFVPVQADDGLQTAIETVKSRIDIPSDLKDFDYNIGESANGKIYNFSWSNDEKRVSANILNDVIINYSTYDSTKMNSSKPTLKGISKDEAKKTALDFIKKINPTISDKIQIEANDFQSISDDGYRFKLQRIENGITYDNNSGKMYVKRLEDKVTDFSIDWSINANFQKPENILSADSAKTKFKENIGLKPEYRFDEEQKSSIVYVLKNDKDIDAFSGNLSKEIIYDGFDTMNKEDSSMGGGGTMPSATLSPEEMKSVEENKELLTKEQAIEIVKNDPYIGYSDMYQLNIANLYLVNKEKSEYEWQLRFNLKEDKDSFSFIYATLDAKTGAIKRFSNNKDLEGSSKKTVEDSKKIVNYYLKDRAELYKYVEFENMQATPYKNNNDNKCFSFVRYHNDIAVTSNQATVIYNADGSVAYFNYDFTDAVMAEPNILSEEEAITKLFEQYSLQLKYKPISIKEQTTQLVYTLDEYIVLDAKTGKTIFDNKEQKYNGYNDINEHWSKEFIERLAEFGIFMKVEQFEPDKTMTMGEFYSLVSKTFGYSNFEHAFEFLRNKGLTFDENIDKNAPLKRIDAVEAIITADGGKEFAELTGIYQIPFNDVTEKIGYVAIAYAKGLVKGYDNQFNPNDTLTRAEGITILYNYCK